MNSNNRFQRQALSLRASLLAAAALAISLAFPAAALRAQEPAAAPTYEQEIATGRDLMRRHKFEDALKAFKRANELKGQASAEAFYLMGTAYMGLEAYKNAVQTADKIIGLAT